MRRIFTFLLILWLLVGIALLTLGYLNTVYRLEVAIGYINRSQSTAFAEDMITYLEKALELIPESGNPVWIFPTKRTDFTLIHSDLLSIKNRLAIVSKLDRDSPAYAQSLSDIRGKLSIITSQLGEAMPYTLITPINITLAIIWLSIPYITYKITRLVNNRNRNQENITK